MKGGVGCQKNLNWYLTKNKKYAILIVTIQLFYNYKEKGSG